MLKGNIKFFNKAKGYGFIIDSESKTEVFFHYTSVKGTAIEMKDENKEVTYELTEGKKGPEAINVKLV